MSYKNAYLQARELSDMISSGEVTSVATDKTEGLVNRKRPDPIQEISPIAKTRDMTLDYFAAIDALPSPKQEEMPTAPTESRKPPSKGFISQDTKSLLAKTLQAEAGNQGIDGMLDVGAVIMNRANSGKFGEGINGVIMKPGQFSAWNSVTGYADGEQGQDMANLRPSKEAMEAAERILSGEYEDRTGGATHYYAIIPGVSEKPKWSNENFKQIGDHYFGNA